MNYNILPLIIHIPLIIFLINYIRKKSRQHPLNTIYYPAALFKIAAGIGVGIVYRFYYNSGDTLLYYDDSLKLGSLCFRDPELFVDTVFLNGVPTDYSFAFAEQPRAFFFVKIISFLNIFAFDDYWIMSAYLSLFSFAGFWRLSKVLVNYFHLPNLAVVFSLFFFPSVVFWSSGVLKDSIAMGCICFIIYYTILFAHGLRRLTWYEYAMVAVFIITLAILKYYYFAVLAPVLLSYSAIVLLQKNVIIKKDDTVAIVLFSVLFCVFIFLATFIHPNLSLNNFVQALYNNYLATLYASIGKHVFVFVNFSPSLLSMIPYIPKAILIGLFRPWPGDISGIFSVPVYIENAVIVILTLTSAYAWVKKKYPVSLSGVAVSTYVLLLAILLTFASPNWGSLLRYKVGFLPFFLLLITSFNPIFIYLSKKIDI